jgi:hypothetical protein
MVAHGRVLEEFGAYKEVAVVYGAVVGRQRRDHNATFHIKFFRDGVENRPDVALVRGVEGGAVLHVEAACAPGAEAAQRVKRGINCLLLGFGPALQGNDDGVQPGQLFGGECAVLNDDSYPVARAPEHGGYVRGAGEVISDNPEHVRSFLDHQPGAGGRERL